MTTLNLLKRHLTPGRVYRRKELEKWSTAVDRHLHTLVEDGTLQKLAGGLYYAPEKSAFGQVPPEEHELVRGFLQDARFLLTSPNDYNTLGVGTTQLYNNRTVYNHKRHGVFELGNRDFEFRVKPYFPKKLSPEYLLVDLVNNLDTLAEDRQAVLEKVKQKAKEMDFRKLNRAVNDYGSLRAKKVFEPLHTHNP